MGSLAPCLSFFPLCTVDRRSDSATWNMDQNGQNTNFAGSRELVQCRLRQLGLWFLCELESATFKDCEASGYPRVPWEPGRIAIVASSKE